MYGQHHLPCKISQKGNTQGGAGAVVAAEAGSQGPEAGFGGAN